MFFFPFLIIIIIIIMNSVVAGALQLTAILILNEGSWNGALTYVCVPLG